MTRDKTSPTLSNQWFYAFGCCLLALFAVAVLWQREVRNQPTPASAVAGGAASAAPPAKPPAAQPKIQRARWEQAIAGVSQAPDKKTDNEGVTYFMACFGGDQCKPK